MNRSLLFASAFAILALVALGVALGWRSADQHRLDDARRENCLAIEQLKAIQRAAIVEDIATAEKFLRENPNGTGGITPDLIRDGITRDQRQIQELAEREC